jgi:hypothetical protein
MKIPYMGYCTLATTLSEKCQNPSLQGQTAPWVATGVLLRVAAFIYVFARMAKTLHGHIIVDVQVVDKNTSFHPILNLTLRWGESSAL